MRRYFPLYFLFLISVILRFFLADYPKHIFVPDESLYYQFAESLAQGRGLKLYGLESNFQKFLYSFILIPAFLFESREIQQNIITFINAFVISSVVFPAYFLAKLFLKEKRNILIILFLTFLSPELAYSATFMSENLFFPLSLWLFYFYVKFIQKNDFQPRFALFLGVFSFLVYLCKEIALFFPAALLLFYLPKLSTNKIKNLAIIFSVFLIFYFIIQFLFFADNINFYTTAIENQKTISTLTFFIAGFLMMLYFLMLAILASGFFPALLPLVFYQNLNPTIQKALLFLIIICVETAIVVSFKIYMNEDFPRENIPPRALLRYLIFAWIPFLCFFISIFENQNFQKPKWLFLIFPFVFIFIFFNGCYAIAPIDNFMLYSLDSKLKHFVFIFKIILFVLMTAFVFYLHNKKQTLFLNVFCAFLALFYIVNNADVYKDQALFYKLKTEEKENVKAIESFIQKHPQQQFVFTTNETNGTNKEFALARTFFNYPNVVVGDFNEYQVGLIKENPIEVLNGRYFNKKTYHLQKIDYFIFPHYLDSQLMQFNLSIVNGKNILSNKNFDIFQNPNPPTFPKIVPINISKKPPFKNKKETHRLFKIIFG